MWLKQHFFCLRGNLKTTKSHVNNLNFYYYFFFFYKFWHKSIPLQSCLCNSSSSSSFLICYSNSVQLHLPCESLNPISLHFVLVYWSVFWFHEWFRKGRCNANLDTNWFIRESLVRAFTRDILYSCKSCEFTHQKKTHTPPPKKKKKTFLAYSCSSRVCKRTHS